MATWTYKGIWEGDFFFFLKSGRAEALNEIRSLLVKKKNEYWLGTELCSFNPKRAEGNCHFIASFTGLLPGGKHCAKPFSPFISI